MRREWMGAKEMYDKSRGLGRKERFKEIIPEQESSTLMEL